MTEEVDRKDFEYLRVVLQEAAPSLAIVVQNVAADRADPRILKTLAEGGAHDLLSASYESLPRGVGDEVAEALERLARSQGCPEPENDELRRLIWHEGFGLAGRFLTEQAFRATSSSRAIRRWMEIFRAYEVASLRAATAASRRQSERCLHQVRVEHAQVLADLVPDSGSIGAILSRLRLSASEPHQVESHAQLPNWLHDGSDGAVVPFIARATNMPSRLKELFVLADSDKPAVDCDLAAVLVVEAPPLHIFVAPVAEAPALARSLAAAPGPGVVIQGLPATRAQLSTSFRSAWRALDLIDDGYLLGERRANTMLFIDCMDIRSELIILADEPLVLSIATQIFAPLRGLAPAKSRALLQTLVSWTSQPTRGVPAIARELDVHPQTVRYRLKTLHSIYGSALDDARLMFLFNLTLRYTRHKFSYEAPASLAGRSYETETERGPK